MNGALKKSVAPIKILRFALVSALVLACFYIRQLQNNISRLRRENDDDFDGYDLESSFLKKQYLPDRPLLFQIKEEESGLCVTGYVKNQKMISLKRM